MTPATSQTTGGGCGSAMEEKGYRDDATALRLKLAMMAAILVTGMVGMAIPLAAVRKRRRHRRLLSTKSDFFVLAEAFVAGVILATGFVHMLHDAKAALTDPCLPRFPWRCSPFSGFIATVAALATLILDLLATQFYERKHPTVETDAAAEDDEERSIITTALKPPVDEDKDEDEDEGSAKGGNAVHIVGMRARAVVHGHNHHQGYIRKTWNIRRVYWNRQNSNFLEITVAH